MVNAKTISLDYNAHSAYLLNYHLILVVKYRKKVFDNNISEFAKELFINIANKYNITLLEWNHDIDHVHILFKAVPSCNLSQFISSYKSASSRIIKQVYPEVKKKLWKEYFWSHSYCLTATGGAPLDVVKKYIENQGENHEQYRNKK